MFEKIWKLVDFRPKNGHFSRFLRSFFYSQFSTKNVSCLWKMLQSVWFLAYTCPKVSSKNLVRRILIFCLKIEFLVILYTSGANFELFSPKNSKNCPPKVHKITKNSILRQKIKILQTNIFRGYLGACVCQISDWLEHFPQTRYIFRRKLTIEKRTRKLRKMAFFWPII